MMDMLQVQGGRIVDAQGNTVRLRGTCVGGWMNMEDFIETQSYLFLSRFTAILSLPTGRYRFE
ncbi:MAG: hypothetical protein ABSE06_01170 [Anaerolineaceae bacterium]|jgi:predicted butyrate kinase (DUF1464 family)